ncbi:MAG: ABC transporter ATP-binding protein [Coriobacteriia bacterium]|nr:ABC transporter ATP-binding protein [Coriobacteriia bacterium]
MAHRGPGGGGGRLSSLVKTEKPTSARATVLRLSRYLMPYRRDLIVGSIWVVLSSVASAATPALTGRIIDVATTAAKSGGGIQPLVVPGLTLVAASIFGWLATRQQIYALGTAGQYALFDARADVIVKIEELDVGYFEAVESGDLMSRLINDIAQVDSFLGQGFRRLLGSAVGLTATLIAMFWVNWQLALATLVVVPLMIGVTRLFGVIARRAFRTRQEAIGDVSATLAEELGGIKVAQAFNRTDRNRGIFTQRNAANRDANVNAAVVSSAFSPVLALISTVATALIAALGGYLAAQQLITIGVVVAFLSYARQFFNAVSQLSSLYSDTQAALAGGERVFSLLDTPVEIAEVPGALTLGRAQGRVEYRDVHFAYKTGTEILHGIDLTIEPGQTLAIVGATGAGKTTMVNLVPRFYDPTQGQMFLDGRDVRDLSLSALRRNFGVVLQDPFLFSGTVAENIRYGALDASDDTVRKAAETAGALEFIDRLPQGFDTPVTERGATLSTGQRQLIAFARAIVGDPAILILDEATSSVDTRTEMLIQRGLRNILKGRTALIIAHRLSTVRDADRVVVVDAGRIVEQGPYDELLEADGPFSALYRAQFTEQ